MAVANAKRPNNQSDWAPPVNSGVRPQEERPYARRSILEQALRRR